MKKVLIFIGLTICFAVVLFLVLGGLCTLLQSQYGEYVVIAFPLLFGGAAIAGIIIEQSEKRNNNNKDNLQADAEDKKCD